MQTDIQILSLNVAHGMLLDELILYLTEKKRTIAVFCIQEADGPSRQSLDDLFLPDYQRFYSEKPSAGDTFSLATYVRKGLNVRAAHTILDNLPGAGFGLTCTIAVNEQTSISVCSVHGQPQPGHKLDTPVRLQQSQELIRSGLSNKGTNIFIGDFNLLPQAESVTLFTQNGYIDLISEYEIPTTRNEIAWSKYPDNKQLYADYAFVEPTKSFTYDFRVEDIDVSDHLPLILSLHVKHATQEAAAEEMAVDNAN